MNKQINLLIKWFIIPSDLKTLQLRLRLNIKVRVSNSSVWGKKPCFLPAIFSFTGGIHLKWPSAGVHCSKT